MASYSNSRDMDKVAQKRAEWNSWSNRPDTEKEVAEKTAKLEICLAFLADIRGGMDADDALDARPDAQVAYDMENWATADSGDIDLVEKICRDKFAIRN